MRRVSLPVSALSVRAMLVGVTILAGTPFFPAHAHKAHDASSLSSESLSGTGLLPDQEGDEMAFAEIRPSLNHSLLDSLHKHWGQEGRSSGMEPPEEHPPKDHQEVGHQETGWSDGAEVGFPHPLSALTAARYHGAFHALREGNLQRAETEISGIEDKILLPDILAERYLRSEAHPTVRELQDWLRAYPHSPDIPAIAALLRKMAPASIGNFVHDDVRGLQRGESVSPLNMAINDAFSSAFTHNAMLEHTLQDLTGRGLVGARTALRVIDHTPGMSPAYAAQLYGDVALGLLSQGNAVEALRIGLAGFGKDRQSGFPAYVAGLAAWHEKRLENSYAMFEAAANATVTESDIKAASAFWAARVESKRGHKRAYYHWLRRAAVYNTNFYGLLAARILQDEKKNTSGSKNANRQVEPVSHLASAHSVEEARQRDSRLALGEVDVAAVMSMAEGRHLFALLQIGEQGRAEALMRRMWPDVIADPGRARSLQLVARDSGVTALSAQMNDSLAQMRQQKQNQSHTPLPQLKPEKGFHFNPALVYAVAWTESRFDAQAASPVGALGMMQIKPTTASFITTKHITYDDHGVAIIPVEPGLPRKLCNPAYNLEVGQRYMMYLADTVAHAGGEASQDGGDLLRVIASYNAGPQAIVNWENLQKEQHDPLYFIETLPNGETRHYVQHVLATAWIYARRMGLSSPSLRRLSVDQWPSFQQEQDIHLLPS